MAEFIGTKVAIPGTRGNGILRYYGQIEGKNGTFGGIELIGPIAASRGKNSGAVDGVQYFEVERPMTGLFLPIERLKSVNPQLSRLNGSRTSSGGSIRYNRTDITPSPIQRKPISRPSSSKGSPFASPYPNKVSQVINIPKRLKAYDSSQSTGSINDVDTRQIANQLNEFRTKYEQSVKELEDKSAILNDLRSTVNQIQPLLEEYERELADKDKRLSKQKTDFEKAREEWRESLNLMASSQQENEAYFESQIEELRTQLKAANNRSNSNEAPNEEFMLLTQNFESLSKEMDSLKREYNATIIEKDNEIKKLMEYQKEIENKSNSSSDYKIGIENDQLREKIRVLETTIDEFKQEISTLKLELDRAQKEDIDRDLAQGIDSVSISDNEDVKEKISQLQKELDEKKQLEQKISDLKHDLEMRPTFDELSELQESIHEIETIHNQESQARHEKIQKLQMENSGLEEKIKELLQINVQQKALLDNPPVKDKLVKPNEPVFVSKPPGDSLPIYQPEKTIDPGAGKDDWCGLCERDGHSSINCPYENDMF